MLSNLYKYSSYGLMFDSAFITLVQSARIFAAMTLKNVCITLINLLIFANTSLYDGSFYPKMNIWESLRPGVLLHTLDQLTVNQQQVDEANIIPLRTPPPAPSQPLPGLATNIHRRVSSSAENQYSTEDHQNADHSNEYDYDKAYDQFVQHYFNSARSAALNEDSASVESQETPYSGDYEEHAEPLTAASKKTPKEKCKKVQRNRQECVICKDLSNNEKSETCSYSTETEPQTYAYDKEKSYKKQKKSSDESNESKASDEDEEKQPSEIVAKAKKSKYKAVRKESPSKIEKSKIDQHTRKIKGLKKLNDTSSCLKKVQRHKICYNCYNPDGEQLIRCYAKSAAGAGNRTRSEQQIQKSEKKIYKRMVSYSYANGKDFDDATSSTEINKIAENSTHADTSP